MLSNVQTFKSGCYNQNLVKLTLIYWLNFLRDEFSRTSSVIVLNWNLSETIKSFFFINLWNLMKRFSCVLSNHLIPYQYSDRSLCTFIAEVSPSFLYHTSYHRSEDKYNYWYKRCYIATVILLNSTSVYCQQSMQSRFALKVRSYFPSRKINSPAGFTGFLREIAKKGVPPIVKLRRKFLTV